MLQRFKVENFYSINTAQEISFEINEKDKLDDSSTKIQNKYLNNISCLLGHNGSGKTNLLRAVTFLFWFIDKSYEHQRSDKTIPIESHKLYSNKNSKFELDFVHENNFYRYIIELNKNYVVKENLSQKIERGYSRIFEITRDSDKKIEKLIFGNKKIKLNNSDFLRLEEKNNISTFSFLKGAGYLTPLKLENFKNIFSNKFSNIFKQGRKWFDPLEASFKYSKQLSESENIFKKVSELIKDFDLGISDLLFRDYKIGLVTENRSIKILHCKHTKGQKSFDLPIVEESEGTQNSIYLLSDLLNILEIGGIAIIDEIETSIHPYVVKKLISLFADKKKNKHNAQLIFSTHQAWFLQDRTKTQIFLVEKDGNLETEVWCLDDMEKIRNDENYFNKYMTGAYGAVPELKWF